MAFHQKLQKRSNIYGDGAARPIAEFEVSFSN